MQRLLRRLRQPRSRAAEIADVRARLRAERARPASDEERALARRMRALRAELTAALGQVGACATCTTGRPWPESAWSGGQCCSGHTADVFTDDEVAALALSGTRARDLAPPPGEHAGCAFRGPTGCALDPADRPSVCARYLCRDLRRELHGDGRLAALLPLLDELDELWGRFSRSRSDRIPDFF
ncbi:MAG TPA: hypothetical protein VL172_22720 [Kofleriaceae bacterium]|nr:hypothetical protein [Kofleriaceae bacterium]